MPASAIVVAGGKSRRLGQDKRQLRLSSSRSLLEETVARLLTVTDDVVVVVASDPEAFRGLPATIVQDVLPGAGPLNGIYTGLAASHHERAVVVACDLPFLNAALLRYLLERSIEHDLVVPRRADGTLELLHAVYRRTCLPAIRRRLDAGQLRLADLVDDVRVDYVDEPELIKHDPDLRSFTNVNTPDDLARAADLLAQISTSQGST